MFKYISQILSSLTPGQRILGLVMILCSVTIITLGPSLINANTTNCEDLKIRVESQNTQIIELNKRVSDLNTSILQNQSECTNRLINKEKEIYDIISEMENELQKNNKPRNNYRLIRLETDSLPIRTIETDETPNNKKVLKMIKNIKSKLHKESSK